MRPDLPIPTPLPTTACPDELLLAAWCDDRLSDGEREPLDVHIARCPRCLELVEGLAPDRTLHLAIAPDHVVRRASALVAPRAGWRFIASGIAASLAIGTLGVWMGFRMASLGGSGQTTERSSVASRPGAFGLLDDGGLDESTLTDPLELVASRLVDGSTS